MTTNTASTPRNEKQPDLDAASLLAVMIELTGVLKEENQQLSERVPAGLTCTIERKVELSEEYQAQWKVLLNRGVRTLSAEPQMLRKLTESASLLRELTDENMVRLEAAANATRSRIEAVMKAMRAQDDKAKRYGANGTMVARRQTLQFSDHEV